VLVGRWGLGVVDADVQNRVGVLGATSLVGACLLLLLSQTGWQVTAFSRRAVGRLGDGVEWRRLPTSGLPSPLDPLPGGEGNLPFWVCVTPIWVLPDYFGLLEAQGARRVVVLSSTSRFTKDDSTDPEEQAVARCLAEAEARVREWAESRGVEWVILRPTLIYGLGRDKNIAEIARFISRFGFFPLFGKANGLRQPIHVADVADACLAALQTPRAANRCYNISGGETLTYRDMVARVFSALDRRLFLLSVPIWAFRLAVAILRRLPRYRQWSTAMAERMNRDLVFDYAEAERDLNVKPRPFVLSAQDLPKQV
jgi:nucleoside-diphosphate-sugar epimerase